MAGGQQKQTFIPKKSIGEEKGKTKRRSWGLFFGISLIIFLLTAASAGGAYAYRAFLEGRVGNMSASLERAKQAFEPSLIRELQRLDTRMEAGQSVLSQHLALSAFFKELSNITLKTVRFEEFSYSYAQNTAEITLQGKAENYSSVALQSDAFAGNPFIKNPIFSNLTLNENGEITFDVSANVDPILISYDESLEN